VVLNCSSPLFFNKALIISRFQYKIYKNGELLSLNIKNWQTTNNLHMLWWSICRMFSSQKIILIKHKTEELLTTYIHCICLIKTRRVATFVHHCLEIESGGCMMGWRPSHCTLGKSGYSHEFNKAKRKGGKIKVSKGPQNLKNRVFFLLYNSLNLRIRGLIILTNYYLW